MVVTLFFSGWIGITIWHTLFVEQSTIAEAFEKKERTVDIEQVQGRDSLKPKSTSLSKFLMSTFNLALSSFLLFALPSLSIQLSISSSIVLIVMNILLPTFHLAFLVTMSSLTTSETEWAIKLILFATLQFPIKFVRFVREFYYTDVWFWTSLLMQVLLERLLPRLAKWMGSLRFMKSVSPTSGYHIDKTQQQLEDGQDGAGASMASPDSTCDISHVSDDDENNEESSENLPKPSDFDIVKTVLPSQHKRVNDLQPLKKDTVTSKVAFKSRQEHQDIKDTPPNPINRLDTVKDSSSTIMRTESTRTFSPKSSKRMSITPRLSTVYSNINSSINELEVGNPESTANHLGRKSTIFDRPTLRRDFRAATIVIRKAVEKVSFAYSMGRNDLALSNYMSTLAGITCAILPSPLDPTWSSIAVLYRPTRSFEDGSEVDRIWHLRWSDKLWHCAMFLFLEFFLETALFTWRLNRIFLSAYFQK
ncbi:hypothetical protein BC829DRAFT_171854 [Chytridium lagenaria]|nr:hypothetical protein BC829DRAFT_171854 [Chytridium lagenaria]